LNERSRRLWAASEARAVGHGGIALVARATGISRSTIERGIAELERDGPVLDADRIRRPGGGRRRAVDKDPSLEADMDALLELEFPRFGGHPQIEANKVSPWHGIRTVLRGEDVEEALLEKMAPVDGDVRVLDRRHRRRVVSVQRDP
jgi:hypothetical protein